MYLLPYISVSRTQGGIFKETGVHSKVESVKRHALTTALLAQCPDCCCLIETIVRLCAIQRSPKKRVTSSVQMVSHFGRLQENKVAHSSQWDSYAADHTSSGRCESPYPGAAAQQEWQDNMVVMHCPFRSF